MKLTNSFILLLHFVCCCFYSCSEKNKSTNTEVIMCNADQEIDINLMAPRKIFASPSGFFVFDTSKKNNFLILYSNKGDSLDSFGKIGDGPGELIMPICNQSNDRLIVSSINGEMYFVADTKGKITVETERKEYSKVFEGSNFIENIDTGVYLLSKTSEKQIQIHDFKTGVSRENSFYPFVVKDDISGYMVNNVLFESNYAYGMGHMFICYKHYPLTSIVDINDNITLQTIEADGNTQNTYSVNNGVVEFTDPTLFYTFSSYADQSFWALFQNSKREELKDNSIRSQIHRISLGQKNPIIYQLDRTIYNFTVSSDGKKIYALYFDKDSEPKICTYTIS